MFALVIAPRGSLLSRLMGKQRFRVLGIVFLALLVGLVWLTYAVFTQKFTHYDRVELQTDSVGLQLPERADVKIRGVIVGEVLDMKADPGGRTATVTLGLYPGKDGVIPANVTGAILPKTLFGEKYVALEVPKDPSAQPIAAGAVIHKTQVSTEVEQVLADLYPLLRTVQPADLNATLNALATALTGRGAELGDSLETLNNYLGRLNPQVPALIQDVKQIRSVSDTYSDVLPELSSVLRNSITTATTLQQRSTQVSQLLTDVTAFSDTANQFLEANGDNLIQLGNVSQPVFNTLARYSPEFPCLLGGLDNLGARVSQAFRGYTLHIVLETLPHQPRAWNPKDKPRFGEDRGPACGHLPSPPWTQSNPLRTVPNLNDGVDEPTGKGTDRAPFTAVSPNSYAGSPAETKVLDTLLAPVLGTTPGHVPDLGALLVGPMARGATVGLQ